MNHLVQRQGKSSSLSSPEGLPLPAVWALLANHIQPGQKLSGETDLHCAFSLPSSLLSGISLYIGRLYQALSLHKSYLNAWGQKGYPAAMVEISPFCFLLLLKLAGTSSLWTKRGYGTGVPNKGSRWLEFGKGMHGGKNPQRGGHNLGEKIPHFRGEGSTPSTWVGSFGATASEQTPEKTSQADVSPPWLQGLCPGTGEHQQLCGNWVVKTSLVCTLGALVVVGNGLVIVVIASSVSGWSHSSRLVLLSLAAADTALALLVVPLNLYRSLALGPVAEESAGAGDTSYCRVVAFINSSIFGASLYSLAGVSLERYIAVFFPLHYRRLLSRRRVALLIMAAWLLPVLLLVPLIVPGPGVVLQVRFSAAALLCEPDYSSNTTYSVLMAGTIFCPTAGAVTFANVRLWLAARSQRHRKKALELPGKEVVRLKRLHLLPLDAASRILLPVVIAFYVCWAPCMGTILYNGESAKGQALQAIYGDW